MIPDAMLPQTVTRIRPSTSTDAYGNTVRDYASPASSLDMTSWVQQDQRDEPLADGRDPLVSDWLLITNETDILGYDRITFDSKTFEVKGDPKPTYTPAGYHHTESTLRLVVG